MYDGVIDATLIKNALGPSRCVAVTTLPGR